MAENRGDQVLVSKAAYVLRSPRRWEVIVFHLFGKTFIKRLIGLGGEVIEIIDGDVYIDGELDVVETANWFPKIARKDYMVGANLSGSGVDDPDAYFFEHYACGSERNYTNYCNPELEKMYEQQSIEPDQTKRKQLVWEIDRRLQEDAARPMIFNYRLGTCRSRAVHGITIMVNSLFNGWRFEDAWLGQ